MIAESRYRAGEFKEANAAFQAAATVENYQLAYLGMARSLLELNRSDASRHYATAVYDSSLLTLARVVQARTYYRQYNFAVGAKILSSSELGTRNSKHLNGDDLSSRSRLLSSALSAVVPGLGHAYAGRAWDGFYSLLVVGTAGAASWYYWTKHDRQDQSYVKFGLCASLGTLFYLGNIYGASIAARDYNQLQKRRYLGQIESILSRSDSMPDYRRLLRVSSGTVDSRE